MFDVIGKHTNTLALYVHIPFCATKCGYCDFNTYSGIEKLIGSYTCALIKEVRLWGAKLSQPQLSSIFFGGGTPSYLDSVHTLKIIESISSAFQIPKDIEITLEANPEDIRIDKLHEYQNAGINRISIGVQSLENNLLKLLGRRHDANTAIQAVRKTIEVGFNNVSIDLMYGLPNQTLKDWRHTLDESSSLGLPHLSIYCLGLEEGTPMSQSVKSGELPKPDPDLAAEMYELTIEQLGNLQYRHYEISNWAQTGFESKHNINYWENQPFLGLGPGAHSYLPNMRFSNIKSPREYIYRLANTTLDLKSSSKKGVKDTVPTIDNLENLSTRTEILDTLMMGLRLDTGISEAKYFTRFGRSLDEQWESTIKSAVDDGLMRWNSDNATKQDNRQLQLTKKGKLFSNEVLSRFFAASTK